MSLTAFEAVIQALEDADVRYLVAGGFAVNAHGYIRLTVDINLVIALDIDNIRQAFKGLAALGYDPSLPISVDEFCSAENRKQWQEDRNMQVLNFNSPRYPATTVDVFVYEPFNFDEEYSKALIGELLPDLDSRFVSLEALIEMKKAAARPRDLDDLMHLRKLLEGPSDG